MKIDILTKDGSPLGVTPGMIYGDNNRIGVGGSEIALLTMCEFLAKAGHDVVLYNDPLDKSSEDVGFEQRPLYSYKPYEDRDVLINFRSPNDKVSCSKGLKVWWSCDQYTIGNFKSFAPEVDRILVISEFHRRHFAAAYGITENVWVTDLPVRLDEYIGFPEIEKIPKRFIFNSVPDRGLTPFRRIWDIITHNHHDATLVITSDYRLWGATANTEGHRMNWVNAKNYEYLGGIGRCRLVREQLQAEFCLYPCVYDELFCISAAENQVAGIKTVSTPQGALETTNMFKTLAIDPTDPRNDITFANTVFEMMDDPDRYNQLVLENQAKAMSRFDPKIITNYWLNEVFA